MKRKIRRKTARKIFKKKIQRKSVRIKFSKKTGKARKIKVKIKKESKPQSYSFLDAPVFKTKIRVIGIGGGGGSIVSEIGRSLEKASFVIADTDVRSMKKKSGIKYFYFGQKITHGLGTGMNTDLAREAALHEKTKISKLLEAQDIIILVGSLGGGMASGAAPVFAQASREMGNVTLGIFTTPFKFEGSKKARIAQKALKSLRGHLNAVITIPNEKIFKIIDEETSITEAFSMVNKNLIESLESLIEMIYNPGLINIDFADVKAILKGRGMTAFLNTAEASGKNRAEEIAEKILKNPLISSNLKPEKILFDVSGSSNLNMLEVDKISRKIAEMNPKAKIIFGISKKHGPKGAPKNRIKTTLLITGPSLSTPAEDEKEQKSFTAGQTEAKKPLHDGGQKDKKEVKQKKPALTKVKIHKKRKSRTRQPSLKKIISVKLNTKEEKPAFRSKGYSGYGQDQQYDKKEMIRRSALEVRKAEEIEEDKRRREEQEWEVPAFLRRTRLKQ